MSEENSTLLTIIGTTRRGGRVYAICRCTCGVEKHILRFNVLSGHSKSCGCLKTKAHIKRIKTHGKSSTLTYQTWAAMRRRCEDKLHEKYKSYGGLGVKMCERWQSFENFLGDMGERPSSDHSIDRFPNKDGNYERGNCRWATRQEQARNKKNNRKITCNGVEKLLCEWAEIAGFPEYIITGRIRIGWSPERAVGTPVRKNSGPNGRTQSQVAPPT